MLVHFGARNPGLEIVEVLDSYLLVSSQFHIFKEVIGAAVSLLDPFECLRRTNAVDLQKDLKDFVIDVKFGVVKTS